MKRVNPRISTTRGTLVALCVLFTSVASAGDPSPRIAAESVRSLAEDAASAWAPDARLLYVENDSSVDADGKAQRWGYLYWSDQRQAGRVYSLSDSKIELAADPQVDLPSLPLQADWIDSAAAVSRAGEAGGADFCTDRAGHIENVVLVRGVFNEKHPERATWTVVYTASNSPALWVVIDAESGDLVKKWEG